MDAETSDFVELYAEVFALCHREVSERAERLTMESLAVLQHLSMIGPLTVGEASRHLDRAQSVVSEMVDHLESKGLLARVRDERDRRRVLVWLTDLGFQQLHDQQEILCPARVGEAMQRLHVSEKTELLRLLRKLVTLT